MRLSAEEIFQRLETKRTRRDIPNTYLMNNSSSSPSDSITPVVIWFIASGESKSKE